MNELLPIGSIVVLKNNTMYMIIGFCPSNINSDIIYDYIVCNPNGLSKKKEDLIEGTDFFFIKKEEIKNVLFIGFQDQEFDIYTDIIRCIIDNMKERQKSKQDLTDKDIKSVYNNIMNKRGLKNER